MLLTLVVFGMDGAGDAADLAGDPDLEAVWVIVAAISLVDMGAADRDAGEPLQLDDDGAECVAGIGVVQRLGVQHELPGVTGVTRETLQPPLFGHHGKGWAQRGQGHSRAMRLGLRLIFG